MVVKRRTFIPEIVGPYDGGVARNIAAAEPPFFQDSNIGDAMVARELIRRRQTISAAANNHDIVFHELAFDVFVGHVGLANDGSPRYAVLPRTGQIAASGRIGMHFEATDSALWNRAKSTP